MPVSSSAWGWTVVAARMLTPADFGVFAVGMSVVMLIDVLRDFGAGTYLVQLQTLERDTVRSAFTVSCIISFGCAAVLALAAVPLGRFYGEPGVGHVVLVLSGALLLNPFSTPANAMLRRQMAFDRLALISVASGLAQNGTSVRLAQLGQGNRAMARASRRPSWCHAGANLKQPMPGPSAEPRGMARHLLLRRLSTATGIARHPRHLPQLIIGACSAPCRWSCSDALRWSAIFPTSSSPARSIPSSCRAGRARPPRRLAQGSLKNIKKKKKKLVLSYRRRCTSRPSASLCSPDPIVRSCSVRNMGRVPAWSA